MDYKKVKVELDSLRNELNNPKKSKLEENFDSTSFKKEENFKDNQVKPKSLEFKVGFNLSMFIYNFMRIIKMSLGYVVLLIIGSSFVYLGFNDRFSIGDEIQVTTTYRLSKGIQSQVVREYGTFGDLLVNRIIPISIGLIIYFGIIVTFFKRFINQKK